MNLSSGAIYKFGNGNVCMITETGLTELTSPGKAIQTSLKHVHRTLLHRKAVEIKKEEALTLISIAWLEV